MPSPEYPMEEGEILLTTWHERRGSSREDETYPNQQLLPLSAHFATDGPHSTTPGARQYTPVPDGPSGNDDMDTDEIHDDGDDGRNANVAGTDREMLTYRPGRYDTLPGERPGFRQARRAYRPWSLRRDSLLGFSVILLGMIATLEYLLVFSWKDEKLATSYENERYLWKYGPTAGEYQTASEQPAVYWGNLEYRVRILVPWKLMSDKPQPAEQSVLLDYVSPMQPVVLFSSARAKHWPVLTAAIGSILITALTVISTSLFAVEPILFTQYASMALSSRINNTLFDQNLIDSSPVLSAMTLLSGNLSMAYPLGTNQQYATDMFGSDEANGTLSARTATVKVATSSLECLRGHIVGQSQFDPEHSFLQVNVSDSSCDSGQLNVTVDQSNITTSLFQTTVSCPGDVTQMVLGFARVKIPPYSGTNQGWDEVINDNPRILNDSAILNSTILFCKPTYSFEDADVTLDSTGIISIAKPKTLLTPTTRPDPLQTVMSARKMIDGFQKALIDAKVSVNGPDADFGVLLSALQAISPSREINRYEDSSHLETDTRELYSAACAQIVHQYMRTAASDKLTGAIVSTNSRLVLNRTSLHLLEAGLALLIFSTFLMSLIRPSVVGLGGLPTLGRLSGILARSDTLETALKDSGVQSTEAMTKRLASGLYTFDHSTNLAVPQINVRGLSSVAKDTMVEGQTAPKWWVPFALGKFTRCAITALPLLLIVALEISYHLSQRPQGLGSVQKNSRYEHYLWTLLPGSIMTTLKLLQQSLTFSVELLDPFLVLKKGSAAAENTLLSGFLSCNALQACFKGFRTRRFAVFSIAFSTLLTPFLTIVISGLFMTLPIETLEPINVAQLDHLLSPSETNVSSCAAQWSPDRLIAANLLIKELIPYPSDTRGNLLFPSLGLPTNESTSLRNASTLMANVTALRPNFICKPLEPSGFQFHIGTHVLNGLDWVARNYTTITYTHEKFRGCSCNSGFPSLSKNFTMYNEPGGQPFAIYEYNPAWSCKDYNFWSGPALLMQADNHTTATCPDITLVHTNTTAQPPTMIGVACQYHIEELPVGLAYNLAQDVPSDVQPIGEAKTLEGFDKLCFRSATNFGQKLHLNSLTGYTYDSLMLAALNGSDPKTMLTSEKLPTLVENVAQICNTFTTQYFSGNLRSKFAVGPMINATLSDPFAREIVSQDRTSTTVLEVVLGMIFICTVISLWLFESDQLVPSDPCSIAAQTSLLAGADFLRLIDSGSESLSNTKMAQTTPFKDHLFSMGWWTREDGTRRFGIDIGQAELEEQENSEQMVGVAADVERGTSGESRMSQEQQQGRDPQTGVETDTVTE
ncbi:hypothetical protein KCU62_g8649, partial [Aureobasidium sp. EXF-3399]